MDMYEPRETNHNKNDALSISTRWHVEDDNDMDVVK